MNNIFESLKAGVMEHRKKEGELESSSQKKTQHELTQEQLADIYFPGQGKIKKSEYPTVIKVTEKSRSSFLIPWLITLVAVVIAAFCLFSTKRIFVDIKVINNRATSLVSEDNSADRSSSNSLLTALSLGDKLPMQNFEFDGASKLKSSKDRSTLTLINSSVAPFARAVLHLGTPVNLSGTKIVFYAKGMRGGENIAFALKDKNNIPAFSKNKIYPFPNALTTDWQRAEIPLFNATKEFDVKNVICLRFEFGSKDTDNKPGDTIMVKDLQVVPL